MTGIDRGPDGVTLEVETPEGAYALEAEHVLAADYADGESFLVTAGRVGAIDYR